MSMALADFLNECSRVLALSEKPTVYEYKRIAKITFLGIIIIGLIGFMIYAIKQLVM